MTVLHEKPGTSESALPSTVDAAAAKFPRFPLGQSGKPFTHLDRLVYHFRRVIEGELLAADGINPAAAHRLATACKAFRAAARCHWLMSRLGPPPDGKLNLEAWQSLQDREVKYSESVDRSLNALGLNVQRSGDNGLPSWLYAPVPAAPAASESPNQEQTTPPDANGATERAIEGQP